MGESFNSGIRQAMLRLALCAVIVSFLAFKVWTLADVLGFFSTVPNNLTCTKVGGNEIVGSEDVAHWRDGIVLVSSGDLGTTFAWGETEAVLGGIFALRVGDSTGEPRYWRVELLARDDKGVPPDQQYGFQPGGIYLSNATQRLYAVSHTDQKSSSGVDVFDIEKLDEFPWLRLRHRTKVTSPLFGNHALNDVVEGAEDGSDLYVSNWVAFGHPIGGETRGSTTEKIKAGLGIPLQVLGVPTTVVYHCKLLSGKCTVAARYFLGANGMTISTNRKLVFVVDPGAKAVYVYKRDALNGALEYSHQIPTKHPGNNVEFVPTASGQAELWLGMMPKLHFTIDVVDAQKTRPFRGEPPEGIQVPSALSTITIDVGGHPTRPESLLYHDGSDVSMVSAAIRVGGKVILGQDFHKGVGVCTEL